MINSPRVCVRCKASISNRNLLRKKSATSSLTPSPFATRGGVRFSFSAATGSSLMDTVARRKSGVKGWSANSRTSPAGEEYQYTSGAVIETPLGTMQGHYEMIDSNGVPFNIEIPVFRLAVPTLIH